MCGIAGIVTKQGTVPDEGLLRRMSANIAHRGPDGEGTWSAPGIALAHRRLAIIDLNPTGAQPMHDQHGGLTIVFNGEIYNYRELRTELEARGAAFRSSSDTETILEAYRAWGIECLQKLRGMFAFALWDGAQKSLLLARDRIGKKPLFYGTMPSGDLVFASELKALAPALEMRPDWDAVRLFIGLQYVPSPKTGFSGVMQLEPGTYGVWTSGEWSVKPYHAWKTDIVSRTDKETDGSIRSKLEEAVKIRQLAADVPVGAFLSGGIDSAAVVAFASKHVDRLKTYTMGFDVPRMSARGGSAWGGDERIEARAIAQAFRTDHHEFEAKPADLLACVDGLARHYDAPYADSSALPLWLLARETAKDIKVVLTGDGGDELFGGYRRYPIYERARRIASIPGAASALRIAAAASRDPRMVRMADTVTAFAKDPTHAYGEMFCGAYFSTQGIRETFKPDFLKDTNASDAVGYVGRRMQGSTALDAAMRFDLASYLPDDLNVKMDRATMRWGLEARAPFLDQELVAFALGLPLKQKVRRGKTKVALKRALKGIVPDDVLGRKKRGFQVPLAEWFRGPLRNELRDRLLDPHAGIARIIRPDAAARLIAENDGGSDHGNRLWMLLSLSIWLSSHVS